MNKADVLFLIILFGGLCTYLMVLFCGLMLKLDEILKAIKEKK